MAWLRELMLEPPHEGGQPVLRTGATVMDGPLDGEIAVPTMAAGAGDGRTSPARLGRRPPAGEPRPC